MLFSKCAVCDSKKAKLIKEQETSALLSTLGIKTPLSKNSFSRSSFDTRYKINEIVNKFLLAGHDRYAFKIARISYSTCQPFTKTKERIQKIKEIVYSRYTHQNELDKACFQHDMAYVDFKELTRRAVSEKILHDKAFNIAKYPKYDGHQRQLASIVYNFF